MVRFNALPTGKILLDTWCTGPRLVIVQIVPAPRGGGLVPSALADATGAGMHLEWEAILEHKSPSIHDRFERAQELTGETKFRWRSGPGTFCIRTAAKVFLTGGVGAWDVELISAPDVNAEARSYFELQRVVETRTFATHRWSPPGHTHLELLAGWLDVGGIVIPPGSPISLAEAERLGWEAQGIVRTYLEV